MVEKVAKKHVFSPGTTVFPYRYHSTDAPIHSFIHHKRYKTVKFRASSSNTKGNTMAAPAISTKTNFFAHINIPPNTLQPKDFSAFMENGIEKNKSDEVSLK
jgi:hypothetical protein